jgi:L-ascorbate metabolism protein UlaG (beta-lactamase superfamily)
VLLAAAALGGLVAVLVAAILVGGTLLSAKGWQGPVTDHFDGQRFHNRRRSAHGGFGAFLRWQRTRHPPRWEDRPGPPGPPPPRRVSGGAMRVTFVNHATVLLQQDGVNVLTDPIWSERASPFSWIGPRRHRPPGLRFEDLPPIDAVVISHCHYDHLDLPTLRRLHQVHHPRFFAGLGTRAILEKAGIPGAVELDWWQSAPLSAGITLTAAPAQHFGNRGLFDRDRVLWVSWMLRGPAGLAYVGGDTGWGPHFAQIRQRLGAPRLAVLPIGAYQPPWFMGEVHESPAEALAAAATLGAGTSVGMHFGTFALADDGQDEAPAALGAELAAQRSPARFWVLGFGEGRDVPSEKGTGGRRGEDGTGDRRPATGNR